MSLFEWDEAFIRAETACFGQSCPIQSLTAFKTRHSLNWSFRRLSQRHCDFREPPAPTGGFRRFGVSSRSQNNSWLARRRRVMSRGKASAERGPTGRFDARRGGYQGERIGCPLQGRGQERLKSYGQAEAFGALTSDRTTPSFSPSNPPPRG